MPITDRSQLKAGGFAQVRAALLKFEGDVTRAEFDQWGGKLLDEDGNPLPPREFLEVECTNNTVLEVSEDLSMDIEERFSFRVNCATATGSPWDIFLESADKAKLLVPDDFVGKRIIWKKVEVPGSEPKYTTNIFVIDKVKTATVVKSAPKVVAKAAPAPVKEVAAEEEEVETTSGTIDPMQAAMVLAVGKTEQQFRTAIGLDPTFQNSPLLPMAKAGVITQALVNEGKLVLADNKYQLPE